MISYPHHVWRRAVAAVATVAVAGTGFWATPATAVPATDVLTWTGATGAATGSAVSQHSCDFTGDGREDIVTSAWMWDRLGGDSTGVAYVIPNGAKPGQLDDPTTGVIRIEGPVTDSGLTGFSVGCAGDVNGDGIDDVVVSQFTESRAFVVFGSREREHVLLDHLGDRGFIIASDSDDRTGFWVTGVNDLNGDGKDDIGVISLTRNKRAGMATIVAGSDDIATVSIPKSSRVIATIEGTPSQGVSTIAPAGDVNGDGHDDLVIGGYVAEPTGSKAPAAGMAWVVFGKVHGHVKLGEKFSGFTINGPERGRDRLGISAIGAGDIDGDGKDDVLLGADGVSHRDSGERGGAAVVVRGSSSTAAVHTNPEAKNGPAVHAQGRDRGWWINGGAKAGNFGYAVSALAPRKPGMSGTLLIGDFSASRAWAIDTRALTSPVISADAVAQDLVVTLDGANAQERLGRGIGVVASMNGRPGHQMVAGGDYIGGVGTIRVAQLPAQGALSTSAPSPTRSHEPSPTRSHEPSPSNPSGDHTDTPIKDGNDTDTPHTGGDNSDDEAGRLPRTGVQLMSTVAAAAVLLGIGATALVLMRRRTR